MIQKSASLTTIPLQFTTLEHKLETLHQEKLYRPVVVNVVYKLPYAYASPGAPIKFLAAKSAKAWINDQQESWNFPQEGIEYGETIEEAFERGLMEELRITRASYEISTGEDLILHYEELDAPSSRKDKRGFSKGKAYFFCAAQMIDLKYNIIPNPSELLEAEWFKPEDLAFKFLETRQERASMSLTVLKKILQKLR